MGALSHPVLPARALLDLPAGLLSPLGALAVAAAAVFVTVVCDAVAMRSRRTHPAALPRSLNRASSLLYVLIPQFIAAALAVALPLTSSPAANQGLGYFLAAGVIFIALLSGALGLYNRAAARRPVSSERPPIPSLPVPPPSDAYLLSYRLGVSELVWLLAYTMLGLVLAIDLVVWVIAEVGSSVPSGVGELFGAFLAVIGAIGGGMLLSGLVFLAPRYTFRADARGLSARHGLWRLTMPWSEAEQFLIRAHRQGYLDFQLIGSGSRVIRFLDRPAPPRRSDGTPRGVLRVSARELAAFIISRTDLQPVMLSPRETEERIRHYIDRRADEMARRAVKLAPDWARKDDRPS